MYVEILGVGKNSQMFLSPAIELFALTGEFEITSQCAGAVTVNWNVAFKSG